MRIPSSSLRIRVAVSLLTAAACVVGVAVARGALGQPPAPPSTVAATADWTCPMHPDVHQDHPGRCPLCGMALVRTTASAAAEAHGEAHESRAETANPARPGVVAPPHDDMADARVPVEIDTRRQQLLGVRLATVETARLTRSVRVPGIVKFDESRWTDVTLRLDGYVRDLYVDRTGAEVRKGQRLFSVYSPDLATALAEYRLAVRSRAALRPDAGSDSASQADRLVDAARLRLGRWEVSDDQIETPEASEPRITFRSPVSGIVMEKSVVRGARVAAGEVLYRIVDPSRVWVDASVYEPDLPLVRVGQQGRIAMDALPGDSRTGRVIYVAPELDGQSRTAIVRFELPNRNGRLKAGMFASVDLEVPLGQGLVVPSDAVLESGLRQLVFVAQGHGYFEPRDVEIGHRADGRTQIVKGLVEGERVAESAAFFIDSESQLRAAAAGYAAASSGSAPPDTGSGRRSPAMSVTLRTTPDPPKAGSVTLTVTLRDPDGLAVTDAAVTVVFAMAAMPSMNMPAMRSEAALSPAGDGVYRGSIDVLMSGRWDVTVLAARGSAAPQATHLTVIAR